MDASIVGNQRQVGPLGNSGHCCLRRFSLLKYSRMLVWTEFDLEFEPEALNPLRLVSDFVDFIPQTQPILFAC